jgi:hypothetical protein
VADPVMVHHVANAMPMGCGRSTDNGCDENRAGNHNGYRLHFWIPFSYYALTDLAALRFHLVKMPDSFTWR